MEYPIKNVLLTKPQINLQGPDGNAYALLGYVKSIGRQLGWDESRISGIQDRMTSSDYAHLLKVFEETVGGYVTIVGRED